MTTPRKRASGGGRKPQNPAAGKRAKVGFTFRQDHADSLREMTSAERNACIDAGIEWALRNPADMDGVY